MKKLLKELNKLNVWILNPTTKLPDTFLSFAVYGFLASIFIIFVSFYLAVATGNEFFIKYLGEILGLFYGPSILAYLGRTYTKNKFNINKE